MLSDGTVALRAWRPADAPALAPKAHRVSPATTSVPARLSTGGCGPAARGRGVVTAAARLLCRWAFDELGLEQIELLVEPRNAASVRLAERLGARRDGARAHPDHPGGRELLAFALTPDRLASA